jgi:MFS family permease
MSDRLLTPRFLVMCAYSFTVFVSLFELLPTAPYRILGLGGSTAAAGLFLGGLTYSSALSAPFTGTLVDRIGHRRSLLVISAVIALMSASYAFMHDYRLLLALVVVHGVVWSGLMTASGAYMTAMLPVTRRAQGLGYWGLSSVMAIAVAPTLGFWVYHFGWFALCLEIAALNLAMTAIAWWLPDDLPQPTAEPRPGTSSRVQWNVLGLATSLAAIAFGYGGLTSFASLFADDLGIAPRSLYLSVMAIATLTVRLALGHTVDRVGHRRTLLRCIVVPPIGVALLALAHGTPMFIASAACFGAGLGLMYPAFAAYIMSHVDASRRGAAFGAYIAAFDTGIGTGSWATGVLIHALGFRPAFAIAAAIAVLALPLFLVLERRLGFLDVR